MRTILAAALAAFACTPAPETECFGVSDAPTADDVQLREPAPGRDYDLHPQTEAEAVESMWNFLRARLDGSDPRVLCLLDEGTIACKAGELPRTADRPRARPYWDCEWTHPEAGRIPAGARSMIFFRDPWTPSDAGAPDAGAPDGGAP